MNKFSDLIFENKRLIELFEETKKDKINDKTDLQISSKKLNFIKRKILINNYKLTEMLNVIEKGVKNDKN